MGWSSGRRPAIAALRRLDYRTPQTLEPPLLPPAPLLLGPSGDATGHGWLLHGGPALSSVLLLCLPRLGIMASAALCIVRHAALRPRSKSFWSMICEPHASLSNHGLSVVFEPCALGGTCAVGYELAVMGRPCWCCRRCELPWEREAKGGGQNLFACTHPFRS
ncbi:hypothetical protein JOL62DRAFT_53804 [Phyllosticta paracitricarpa]|uniref:Uncharacterized protein n=1 Tax=Phyllosticta paracitricarpa TaxID=2016321 RepID=A0ABR1N9T7_9PEZI